jgi:hypothetical protein
MRRILVKASVRCHNRALRADLQVETVLETRTSLDTYFPGICFSWVKPWGVYKTHRLLIYFHILISMPRQIYAGVIASIYIHNTVGLEYISRPVYSYK